MICVSHLVALPSLLHPVRSLILRPQTFFFVAFVQDSAPFFFFFFRFLAVELIA